MRSNRVMLLGVVALSLLLLVPGAVVAAKTFKLGVLGPFTGPAAKVGEEFRTSVEMAFDKIDYTIGDYTIDLVWIDSQSDPAKATNAYAEAVEGKGVQVGILNWHSSVAAAVMDVAAQYKVPHLFGMGAAAIVNEKYTSDPDKYVYWPAKGWPVPGKLMVGYVTALMNAKEQGLWKPANQKVAIYGEDTDWGRSTAAAFKEEFQKAGWEIVSEDFFPFTQTDFYPLMSKYRKAKVSVLAGTSTSAPSISGFIKQARETGVKAAIVADGLGWMGEWYDMAGDSSDGVLDMIPQLSTPASREWAKVKEERFGYPPSPSSSGLAYDYTGFFIKIAQHTFDTYGKLDKATVFKVIQEEVMTGKLTYTAADGALIMNEYKYTADSVPDPVIARDAFFFPVIQYKGGKGAIVFPEDWAERDPEFMN